MAFSHSFFSDALTVLMKKRNDFKSAKEPVAIKGVIHMDVFKFYMRI